jgi:hypothetical protein
MFKEPNLRIFRERLKIIWEGKERKKEKKDVPE